MKIIALIPLFLGLLVFDSYSTTAIARDENSIVKFQDFYYQINSPTTVSLICDYRNFKNDYQTSNCIIPELITFQNKTYQVTGIMDAAFIYHKSIRKVVIPKTIINIAPNAFKNDSIAHIEVDSENPFFTSIEGVLFSKDSSILIRYPCNHPSKDFNILEKVESIGTTAFLNCCYLETIAVPSLKKQERDITFQGCNNLASIQVSSDNALFSSINGVLYNKAGNTLLLYPANKSDTVFKIPGGVTKLLELSFDGCKKLREVYCSPRLKIIDAISFNNCENLTSVYLLDSVCTIGSTAFRNCEKLSLIDFGKSTCLIIQELFYNCPKLKNVSIDKNNSQYTTEKDVVFNKNKTVALFYPPGKTDSMYVLPTTVQSINPYCFASSSHLGTVKLPQGLKSIGNAAFMNSSIRHIKLPQGLKSIGYAAFMNSGIRHIQLPESLATIGDYSFWKCSNLQSITVNWVKPPVLKPSVFSEQHTFRLIVPDTLKELYQKEPVWRQFYDVKGNVFTLNGVQYKEYAPNYLSIQRFDSTVTSITINPTLVLNGELFHITSLQSDTLINNTLKSITLNGTSIYLWYNNLKQFHTLTEIDVINSNESYTSINGVLYNNNSTELIFYPKGKLDTLFVVPSSVKQIANYAFWENTHLKQVIFPSSVYRIQYGAFYDCVGLTSIEIPSTISILDGNVFNGCLNLQQVKLPNTIKEIGDYTFSRCIKLKSIQLPNQLEEIGNNTFWGCQSLQSIDIPNSVERMGKYVFSNCSGLTSVKLSEQLTTLNKSSFWGCKNLLEVQIPNSVCFIDSSVFEGCTRLQKVDLPNTLKGLPHHLFYNCNSLVDLKLPDSLRIIGKRALWNCTSLNQLKIPNTVAEIDTSAFTNCKSLKQVTLSANLRNLKPMLFYGCIKLSAIQLPDSLKQIGNSAFSHCNSLSELVISPGVTSIGAGAFYNCTQLYSIIFPASLKRIEEGTCLNCTSLQNVKLHETLTYIGKKAFSYCTSLKDVSIPNTVTEIDTSAFFWCTNLTGIQLPKSLTNIRHQLFYNCKQLTTITIPSSVKSIEKNAFFMCENIQTIRMLNPKPIQLSGNVFSSISREKCLLLVPKSSIDFYKTTAYWSTFKANIYPL